MKPPWALSSADRPIYHFVAVEHSKSKGRDRRQWELSDAAARSHAARISHARRKPLPSNAQKSLVLGRSTEENQDQIPQDNAMHKAVTTSNSSLDVQLSLALSLEERNLVHEYLTEDPRAVYGTTTRSASCPVRATTLEGIAVNEIWLRWVLVLAHYRTLRLRNRNPQYDLGLLQYRSSVYRLMSRKVSSSTPEEASDEVFYGLLIAGISEDRVGDTAQASCHLEAGLKLLDTRRRSGLQRPHSTTADLVICSAYIGAGVQDYFKTRNQLFAVQTSLFRQLRSMTRWNRDLRQHSVDVPSFAACKDVNMASEPPSEAYITIRKAICETQSVFRSLVHEISDKSASFDIRAWLGALFAFNTILWACRSEECVAIEFIEELTRVLIDSETHTVLNQTNKLMPITVMYIISYCGLNLHKKYGSNRTWFDLWRIVEFVELMMLTAPCTRRKVSQMLETWLLTDIMDSQDLVLFTETDESEMIDEIETAWVKKHKRLGTIGATL